MSDKLLFVLLGVLIAFNMVIAFIVTRRRHNRDHRADLEPILAMHGLTYVSEVRPRRSSESPFPRIEVRLGRVVYTQIGPIRGEYREYRIVSVKDAEGRPHELWAMMIFETFRLRQIHWRSNNAHYLPLESRKMLENQG